MKTSFTIVLSAALSLLVAADAVHQRDDIVNVFTGHTARSWVPLVEPRGFLQARACLATCSNGGCCNTGGPCTTDGMCCPSGSIACSDGGCCKSSETCATVGGVQTCQSTQGCVAPPVTCGTACCDAGQVCVTLGSQFRCQAPQNVVSSSSSSSHPPSTTSSVSKPVLGDGNRTSGSLSATKTAATLSATTSSDTPTQTKDVAALSSTASAAAVSSKSSAIGQFRSVSGIQLAINGLATLGFVAVLVLVY
jgi:hypothetical protein